MDNLVSEFKDYAGNQSDIGYTVFLVAFSDQDMADFFSSNKVSNIDSAIEAADRYVGLK
ncbi:hypothetical protein OCT63_19760 [Vibrio sp. RW]|uniref:hypothetical protein n=1 Tax=Vibrio sp. RW TaxID=2998833 RepID=UPI0022CD4664|nr:hypothetical protein [Vibrio sp. RW]MDA0146466.1 hypothetical protein [Vibrio sp. RW]